MSEQTTPDPAPGRAPTGESEATADSAPPGRKAIDETRESSEERREHPGTADREEESS
jgi:hypothetical protein